MGKIQIKHKLHFGNSVIRRLNDCLRIIFKSNSKKMENIFSGKTILITGSTDGLGKALAIQLASKGAEILLHGRNSTKGEMVAKDIRAKYKDARLSYYNADFTKLDEVNALSTKLLKENKCIDMLINNAGVGTYDNIRTDIGLEITMTVNYIAQVLLTEKLLSLIPNNTGKIVNIASASQANIDFLDFAMKKSFEGYSAYSKSKTALIMYTMDLAERLKSHGIVVNALHPASLMNTNMAGNSLAINSVDTGVLAVESLLYYNSSGDYFNGTKLSKGINQIYDMPSRETLNKITLDILAKYL